LAIRSDPTARGPAGYQSVVPQAANLRFERAIHIHREAAANRAGVKRTCVEAWP